MSIQAPAQILCETHVVKLFATIEGIDAVAVPDVLTKELLVVVEYLAGNLLQVLTHQRGPFVRHSSLVMYFAVAHGRPVVAWLASVFCPSLGLRNERFDTIWAMTRSLVRPFRRREGL
jgi:hypothetical protein